MIILFLDGFEVNMPIKIQEINKVCFIKTHAMTGTLYPNSSAESLHSKDSFSLRTLIPILVIIDLVHSDLIFLIQEKINIKNRINFLMSYMSCFEDNKGKRKPLKKRKIF